MFTSQHRPRDPQAFRSLFLTVLAFGLVVLLQACGRSEKSKPAAACVPHCEAACGSDDGCGGQCGGCAAGQRCSGGQCVAEDCPDCKENELCVGGQCVCTPKCEGPDCLDDGCGNKSAALPEGQVRNANGEVVTPTDCHDSCASTGFTCGNVCGEECGACAAGEGCQFGTCACQPKCDGTSCSDGCGGLCDCTAGNVCNAVESCVAPSECKDTCESTGRVCGEMCGQSCGLCGDGKSCVAGQCRDALNCDDCALKFSVVSKEVVDGKIRSVVLALDYQPADGEPRPRLADFRIAASRRVELVEVEEGDALEQAGKKLFRDEVAKRNFQRRRDGSYQLFAYGVSDVETLQPGRIVTLKFSLQELGPVSFSLTRRAEVFAPPPADSALQSTSYDHAVVVSR